MLAVEGLYDELEEQKMEKDVVAYKNTFLVPIYTSVRAIITKLKFSEIDDIFNELQVTIYGLGQSLGKDTPEFSAKKAEAEQVYMKLIRKVKLDLAQPKNKLMRLREQLILVVNLLIKWREYTKILRMSFATAKRIVEEVKPEEQKLASTMSKEKAQEIIREKKQSYINGEEEFDMEDKINEESAVADEKEVSSLQDFFKEYTDIINPFLSNEQMHQIERDFLAIKEANNSIYGKLRQQPTVTSDEFFKNVLMSEKGERSGPTGEKKALKEEDSDGLFRMLNLIYETVF